MGIGNIYSTHYNNYRGLLNYNYVKLATPTGDNIRKGGGLIQRPGESIFGQYTMKRHLIWMLAQVGQGLHRTLTWVEPPDGLLPGWGQGLHRTLNTWVCGAAGRTAPRVGVKGVGWGGWGCTGVGSGGGVGGVVQGWVRVVVVCVGRGPRYSPFHFACVHSCIHTYVHTCMHTDRHPDKHTYTHTDSWTDRHTDR